jgi:hypothetical protein
MSGSSSNAAPAPAAASSSGASGKRKAGPGAPAWKAAAGKQAQEALRQSERLKGRRKHEPAAAAIQEQLVTEGSAISSPYAAKQAKGLTNQLFASAGGLTNAAKVMEKMVNLPEMRVVMLFVENPGVKLKLPDRLLRNFVAFLTGHLRTKGTRHAEDQNIHDALLTAMVDGSMIKDELINAVATFLGQRWHAVKDAVIRRMKIDAEETELKHGVWTRRAREKRCDGYELPGFHAFQHDETIFRFSSRHSEPLRLHVGLREYEVRPPSAAAPSTRHHLPHTPPLTISDPLVHACRSTGRVRCPT